MCSPALGWCSCGAAPGHTMVHLAMQVADAEGVDVAWLSPVSDQEYAAAAQP